MFDSLFLYSALIGGTVLAFQFVMMLLGLGDDGGDLAGGDGFEVGADEADFSGGLDGDVGDLGDAGEQAHPSWSEAADVDAGHPGGHWFYEMLSLRTISAALTFFGVAGKTSLAYGLEQPTALLIALAAGAAAMYAVFWMFQQIYRLQHAGNENIRNAIGKDATVYVPIPASGGGAGKVQFKMQNRLVEYQAVTDNSDALPTGANVVVTGIVNADTVRVAVEASLPDTMPAANV